MKKSIVFFLLICSNIIPIFAQGNLTTPPTGGNKKAAVMEQIGVTEVKIDYNRPGVKGREGKIYGTSIAYYGMDDLGFIVDKSPWRAGANENSTISFSTDVKIEGQPLAAGTYGLFMLLGESENTLVLSKNSTSWGSYFYDEKEDALRVKMKNATNNESVEWLKFEFLNQTPNSAEVALLWEKRIMSFKVEVDLHQTQIALFQKELRSGRGFEWESLWQAADYCATNNVALEQGLAWVNTAINQPFISTKNFKTLSTRALLLEKTGKMDDAKSQMADALKLGTEQEVHFHARGLLSAKQNQQAFDIFKMNYDKFPDTYTTNMGMSRAYSALGDYKKALDFAKKATAKAPNDNTKKQIEGLMKKLEEGKDINEVMKIIKRMK